MQLYDPLPVQRNLAKFLLKIRLFIYGEKLYKIYAIVGNTIQHMKVKILDKFKCINFKVYDSGYELTDDIDVDLVYWNPVSYHKKKIDN
jgi:hypothetical protein